MSVVVAFLIKLMSDEKVIGLLIKGVEMLVARSSNDLDDKVLDEVKKQLKQD